MLKSQQRLRNNRDFIKVFKRGKRHSFGGILLSYTPNKLDYTRIGFVISKKFSPLAVRRNWQRRVLQSAMRSLYPNLKPGFDIIISYTNRNKVLPYRDALSILTELFTKTNLIDS
ncbi:MAG TPA: ribonuclease P protein component [Candidatus Pacebacteria bacterium]|nr:ribonuclease P protein component [Candidatus Paceibacterota bacterium]